MIPEVEHKLKNNLTLTFLEFRDECWELIYQHLDWRNAEDDEYDSNNIPQILHNCYEVYLYLRGEDHENWSIDE